MKQTLAEKAIFSSCLLILSLLLVNCGKNDKKSESSSQESHKEITIIEHTKTVQLRKEKTFKLASLPLTLSVRWTNGPFPDPTLNSNLLLEFIDKQGELQDLPKNVTLQIIGDMPQHGHGTHPDEGDGALERLHKGLYLNGKMKFTMEGTWRMQIVLHSMSENIDLETVTFNQEIQ